MTDDPENTRVEELLDRQRRGETTPAETEELALYVAEHPELAHRVQQGERDRALGQGWLARVEADAKIKQLEEANPRVRIERGLGLGMVIGGFVLNMFVPVVGGLTAVAGAGLLLYSFARARIAAHKTDPYKDVVK